MASAAREFFSDRFAEIPAAGLTEKGAEVSAAEVACTFVVTPSLAVRD